MYANAIQREDLVMSDIIIIIIYLIYLRKKVEELAKALASRFHLPSLLAPNIRLG